MKGLLINCIYGVLYLLSLLPMRIHYLFSDFFYLLVYYVVRYRVKLVRKNLADSFPEKSAEELRKTEKAFYHWFCDYVVETIKLISISKKELQRRMVFKGVEVIDEMIENGQSCAMYLGHYCNWEWVSSFPLWATPKAKCGQIYHPLENKEFGKQQQPIVVGYIADQVPFWNNIHHWIDFLNHDTPVLTGTERLVRSAGHAVVYLDMTRPRRGYYVGEIKLITRDPKQTKDYELTDAYFRLLEESIRRAPQYWLWTHKLLEESIRRAPQYWLWTHNRWKRTHEEFNIRYDEETGRVSLEPLDVIKKRKGLL